MVKNIINCNIKFTPNFDPDLGTACASLVVIISFFIMQNRTVAQISKSINSKPWVNCEHVCNDKNESFGKSGLGFDRQNRVFGSYRSNTFSYFTPTNRAVTAEFDK